VALTRDAPVVAERGLDADPEAPQPATTITASAAAASPTAAANLRRLARVDGEAVPVKRALAAAGGLDGEQRGHCYGPPRS
jgi:hypothetical protein